MQWKRRSAALITSFVLLSCALAGCNRGEPVDNGSGSTASSGDAVATLTTPKGTVLTLTQPEFYTELQNYVPSPTLSATPLPAGRVVLQQMLSNLLMEGLAADQGVPPTDAQVQTQYQNTKMVEDARNIKPFDQRLTDAGLTPQLFQDLRVRPSIAQLNLLTKGVTVTDADIQTYYNQNKVTAFTKPERAHIKRIALAKAADAQQIYKIIQGGQTFESQIPKTLGQPADADVALWVPLDGNDPKSAPLRKLIRATQPGQTTPAVAVPNQDGSVTYWLVKVVEKRPKEVLALSDLKDLIRFNLLQEKAQQNVAGQEAIRDQMRAFQTQAKIAIAGPQYASLQQELSHPPAPAPSGGSPFGTGQP